MSQARTKKIRFYLKWVLWILLAQFVLGNISAAIYAYKFTHFYKHPASWNVGRPKNVFDKTWKLFKGPEFGKDDHETAPDFPYDSLKFQLSNGNKIDVWYSAVPNAKGTICIFHGLTSNKSFYTKEAAQYRDYGFNVLLLDFRGHGKSEGMTTGMGYLESEEVKMAYDYVKRKGEQNIYLFGGSMGAVAVARSVAVNQLNPAGIILDMPFDGLFDHIKARGRSFGFPPKWFAIPVCCWISIENSLPAFKHKTSLYAKDIHCPVLLQWGTADHLVTEKETHSIFDALASKDKHLAVYNEGVHSSLFAQDPDRWKKEMEAFLHLHQ